MWRKRLSAGRPRAVTGVDVEKFKFDIHQFSHIEQLALIGDSSWELDTAFWKPFTTVEVQKIDE